MLLYFSHAALWSTVCSHAVGMSVESAMVLTPVQSEATEKRQIPQCYTYSLTTRCTEPQRRALVAVGRTRGLPDY